MGLTDKVIKNVFFHLLSQIVGFVFPLILTPYIITNIGDVQFGIYALVFGIIGTFGLFDISVSTSFIKFISEYYNQNKKQELINFINTGFALYFSFSLILTIIGYLFSGFFISLINVPAELFETGILALRICLLIFFIATSFTIFVSVLISLQKIYLSSISMIILGFINLGLTFLFLNLGFGLIGVISSQLITVILSTIINVILVKREIPFLAFGFKYLSKISFKEMFGFGMQMQVSKLSGFVSEKYEEFLLGFFSVLNNVTSFNIGGKMSRLGRFVPHQIYLQVFPVASELNSKNEKDKLLLLFFETTRYLLIISLPIFTYIFLFSDIIIFAWMGEKYEMSVYILKILIIGQAVNIGFSAPGNAIIPNTGIPKYVMNEGLINLGINLILSYFLIKNYGIMGAAIGSTAAVIVSSFYIFFTSVKFYKQKFSILLYREYLKPFFAAFVSGGISYFSLIISERFLDVFLNRLSAFGGLLIAGVVYVSTFILLISRMKYLNERDKLLLQKILYKMFPFRMKNPDAL